MKKKPYQLYYGWVIVVISFFTLFFALGVRFSFGVFFIAILTEYGWGRGETAGAFSLAMVVHALFAPMTGTLIDRFGPRKLFPIGAILLIMGLVAASRITAIWQLYVFFGVAIAIAINTLSYSPHMSLIPRWFIRKRGLATGLVLSGVGMGTMVLVPLTEVMIDTFGWRSAFLLLAGIIFCVVFPMTALFHRRSPEEVGQHPDGMTTGFNGNLSSQPEELTKKISSSNLPEQWSLKAALCAKAFWYLELTAFSNGFLTNMLLVHQAVHIVDIGYSKFLAAFLLGVVGLLGSVGGILCGFLSDRVGREISYTLGSIGVFVGVVFLILLPDSTSPLMLCTFVVLYGLGYGSMGPMVASATGDLFPGGSLGRIMAIQSIGYGLGGALGPYLGGYFHDQMGSYFVPFLLLLASICIGILGMWMAAPRHRDFLYKSAPA